MVDIAAALTEAMQMDASMIGRANGAPAARPSGRAIPSSERRESSLQSFPVPSSSAAGSVPPLLRGGPAPELRPRCPHPSLSSWHPSLSCVHQNYNKGRIQEVFTGSANVTSGRSCHDCLGSLEQACSN